MGAAPGLIQKIYDKHASYQRPIFIEEKEADIVVTKDSWAEYLGKPECVCAFVSLTTGDSDFDAGHMVHSSSSSPRRLNVWVPLLPWRRMCFGLRPMSTERKC